ncbi:hypothetical protein RvY_03536-2 [Ramazzottius varieornatus]|uniref:Uncharacterized protein n=1 Tax=Ramazzottius varieornatus TaxID=947166 RepID=A0A1D1URT2_RAMVA|nr:hypothetical protein RvY_03536-2 [Ramazzottius varieornatus]
MYRKMFDNQKVTLQGELEDLKAETGMWQELAQRLMVELMKGCRYPTFLQLEHVRLSWCQAADLVKDAIDQEDKKVVGVLRDMGRNWMIQVHGLATVLMSSRHTLLSQLKIIGQDFEKLFAVHGEHDWGDCDCVEHLPKVLQPWIHDTHWILAQLQPAIQQSNQDVLNKVKDEFKALICEALSAMICHGQHDRFPSTTLHQAEGEENSDEASGAVKTFNHLLHCRRQLDMDVSLLSSFPPLIDLHHLYQHFFAYHAECRNLICGPDILPKLIGDLIESMDQLLFLIEERGVVFCGEAGRLTSHVFCFMEKLDTIMRCLEPAEGCEKGSRAVKKASLKELIRKLKPAASSWTLKYENELQKSLGAVTHKSSTLLDKMFLFGINAMLLITPDLVFEEERYKQLYKRHGDSDVERAITTLEGEEDKLIQEVMDFSHNLDFMAEWGNTRKEEGRAVSSCRGMCSIKCRPMNGSV